MAYKDLRLPAQQGNQAGLAYYFSTVHLDQVAHLYKRSLQSQYSRPMQRKLTKARVPAITKYILEDPNYVLPPVTFLVDHLDLRFTKVTDQQDAYNLGFLTIPGEAGILVIDGQHRCAAIAAALEKKPTLRYETLACVFHSYFGYQRSQQMFADLNAHAVRPPRSITVLFDWHDPYAVMAREVIKQVPVFQGLTEMERSSLPPSSPCLFTLSGIYRAIKEVLAGIPQDEAAQHREKVFRYWNLVAENMEDWKRCQNGYPACELRRESVGAHTLALVALGRAGARILGRLPETWPDILHGLKDVDWRISNKTVWEGRATAGGKICMSRANETLVAEYLLGALGLREELAGRPAAAQGQASAYPQGEAAQK